MLKKILIIIGYTLLISALGVYFFYAETLSRKGKESEVCRDITVTLLDSLENRFVAKSEVVEIIEDFTGTVIGKKRKEINLANIESILEKRSAIKEAQVSLSSNGTLAVEITQRRPLLRIQTENGGFYLDETGYIFPLVGSFTSYVPIVTGYIPLRLDPGHRGNATKDIDGWCQKIVGMGIYLRENPFWDAMVEQIYVQKNGDVIFSPKVGDFEIIFGDLNNIEKKFSKLLAFYKNIAPHEGWDKYSQVNLKYNGQIVCKLKKSKKNR